MQITTAQLATAVSKVGRVPRNPSHPFYLENKPWQLQPFCIAPVLPGETMKRALLQSRVLSDGVKNPLIGWWNEYYLFYVKLRDLDLRDEVEQLLMTPDADPHALGLGADRTDGVDYYSMHPEFYSRGGMNWLKLCYDRIVSEWFREEEDGTHTLDGLAMATCRSSPMWDDSLKLDSTVIVQDEELPGETATPPGIYPGFEAHYAQWEQLRALQMTAATFDDWLRQFGVKVPKQDAEQLHRPELLRYIRDWKYPKVGTDFAGNAANVLFWEHQESIDKDRYFSEPGFLVGVHTTRPKVYLGRQYGAAYSMLMDAYSWLPAVLSDDPYTSVRKFNVNNNYSPFGAFPGDASTSEAWWVDLRDLYLYGDQFVNKTSSEAWWGTPLFDGAPNWTMLPDANLQRRFAAETDIAPLFKTAGKNYIRQDGVINFSILGRQVDKT